MGRPDFQPELTEANRRRAGSSITSVGVPDQAEDQGDSVTFMFESAGQERVSDFELKLMDIDSEQCACRPAFRAAFRTDAHPQRLGGLGLRWALPGQACADT